MTPERVMLIAGEPSGDALAAELVQALRTALAAWDARPTADFQPLRTGLAPEFFGAGGPLMAGAGVELAFDMTQHSVIGLLEAAKQYGKFRRLLKQLVELAVERQPVAIICVDFSGFNRRFAHVVKKIVRAQRGPFRNWRPKIIQYVSPQVWASRPGRARAMAKDFDLLLSIFPFEKRWYSERAPALRVEFVGHPVCDRFQACRSPSTDGPISSLAGAHDEAALSPGDSTAAGGTLIFAQPLVLLLPGSRLGELRRHLPVLQEAARLIKEVRSETRFRMVLPNAELLRVAEDSFGISRGLPVQVGGLAESLAQATLAIAATGTVTMECACFGVPAVTLYKTSWGTYQIGKRLIRVKFLAMPNLLAGAAVYPEFIQQEATGEKISRAALELLSDEARRNKVKARLAEVVSALGGPGASARAAEAIVTLLGQPVLPRSRTRPLVGWR